MHSRPTFTVSIETRMLIDKLREAKIGETVSYDDLNRAAGSDVRENRSSLQSARRILQRDSSMVFDVIPKVGLKRLDDIGIVDTSSQTISHVRRALRKQTAKLACVEKYEALPSSVRARLDTDRTVLGTLEIFSTPKAVARIGAAVLEKTKSLPLDETLKLFEPKSH